MVCVCEGSPAAAAVDVRSGAAEAARTPDAARPPRPPFFKSGCDEDGKSGGRCTNARNAAPAVGGRPGLPGPAAKAAAAAAAAAVGDPAAAVAGRFGGGLPTSLSDCTRLGAPTLPAGAGATDRVIGRAFGVGFLGADAASAAVA